ncbi:PTS transporter subunit EIIC [Bacillus sp. ISL-40]|uniref:PTS transporter subunit EIIC n=1 Tax=unclassified Bacillus (in: firmicutes) TaxID=185979 RepID=UPI001BEC0977|nr:MULTISPECIES: PTS transporter subunit EIIC [unclassified Bacillus (in: firmicutes)]MBT2698969.1 PTS transporter subunit EIIC [Bacillus sp. ISL-40]MBT2721068.1 PTS transporter subunit EIIC [Bacillus sp. ISL-46]MBT2742631.1 PTS transporter subunit EIIC [Bacillus sp. ISL-77]
MGENKYERIGNEIVKVIGMDNIESYTHCATRLRISVKDREMINDEAIERIDEVKGVFYNAGQYQIILGTGTVNKVYAALKGNQPDQMVEQPNKEASSSHKEKGIRRAVRTLADIFIPIIPIIAATGLFLGLKGVLFSDAFLGLIDMSSKDIPGNLKTLTSVLTDTAFAFLPALICWSAFRNFGGMPIIGFVLGLMLVSPALPNAYAVADVNSGVEPLMAFGFIPVVGYQGKVLTALVVGILGAKLEKKLRAIMPNALDLIFTPFFVLLTMMITGLLIIGPLLHFVESGLVTVITKLISAPLGIGGLLIGFLYPLAVMTGMHHLFIAIETTLLANTGFNPLITLCAMYGFANAGVCLGITLKAKKKTVKVTGMSATLTQLLGVSEPALFGVVMRYSMKPLYVMIACSAVGGAILSFLNIKANSYGLAVVLSPLMYIYEWNQLAVYVVVSILIFVAAFIITYLFAVPKAVMENDQDQSKSRAS